MSRPIIALFAMAAGIAMAQPKPVPDEEFARLVKEWTTKPEFMTPVVDHLPKVAGIPSPKDVLGYYVGAPKKLTNTDGLARYYRALAAATPRVKVFEAGKTDEGRECLVAAVARRRDDGNLDTYKEYLAKLADPRGLSEAEAKRIIGAGEAGVSLLRRAALGRNRSARDADGAGLPAGGGGFAAHRCKSARTSS